MNSFTPIIKEFVIDRIMNSRMAPKISFKGIFILWFAAVWGVLGSGFLLYAGYLFLQAHYPPNIAALIASLAAIAFSLAVALTGVRIMKRPDTRPQTHHEDITHVVNELFDSIGEELEEPIRDNPKTALMVATLAGYLAGNHAQ